MGLIRDIGKPLVFSKDFDSVDEAEAWLRARNCSVGRMQAEAPIGVLRNTAEHEFDIQKWRNLDKRQRQALDGVVMLRGPRTHRTAQVLLSFAPSEERGER
jgi:hypothetical protein